MLQSQAVLAGHLVGGGLGVGDAIVEYHNITARYDLGLASVLGVASPLSDRRRDEACQQADDRQHAQHFSNPAIHRKTSAILRIIKRVSPLMILTLFYNTSSTAPGFPADDT